MKIINPATTEVIADIPEDTAASVAQKFAAANEQSAAAAGHGKNVPSIIGQGVSCPSY